MTTASSVLLVIGGSQVGKRAVAGRLTGIPVPSDHHTCDWTIDTKYYTARTTVKVHRLEDHAGDPPFAEAVVLVCDASDSASYERTRAWAEENDTSAAEVRLFLVNKMDTLVHSAHPLQRPTWMLDCMHWCTNNLFEYIEVSAVQEELDRTLCLDGEAQGMLRVTSALQAHTWPGFALKARCGDGEVHQAPPPADEAAAGLPEAFTNGGKEDHVQRSVEAHACTLQPQQEGSDADAEGETADSTRYEHMLNTMSSARERLSHMPDNDRRQAAADLALRLLTEFGLESDSDDDPQEHD